MLETDFRKKAGALERSAIQLAAGLLQVSLILWVVGPGANAGQAQEEPAEEPSADQPAEVTRETPVVDHNFDLEPPPQTDSSPVESTDEPMLPPESLETTAPASPATGVNDDQGTLLPPHLERLERLLVEPPPRGAIRLLMEELAAASRTPELSARLRGFAALGACFESADCDLEGDVLREINRLAEIGEQSELAGRLEALRRLVASLGTPETTDGLAGSLEELARFASSENPRVATGFEKLADLDSLLSSDEDEAEILSGVASYMRWAGGASEETADDIPGELAILKLEELANFSLLLEEAVEDEMLDQVSRLLPGDHLAVPRLRKLAELSRVVNGNAGTEAQQVPASLEELARLLEEANPQSAERVRSLSGVNSAVDGPPIGSSGRALIALANLFPAESVEERQRLLALADFDGILGSQHFETTAAILKQASDLAALDNPASASALLTLTGVFESIAYPAAAAIPAALDSVAALFDQGNPSASATVRSLGTIGGVVHSSSDKALPRALERAQRALSKKSPDAASAFGELAKQSETRITQVQAEDGATKAKQGGLLRSLLLTGAAVVVGQENPTAGEALAKVASGESVKRAALQGVADIAGQGELDDVLGDTGAEVVGSLSEGMVISALSHEQGTSGALGIDRSTTPGESLDVLPTDAIRFSNATHEWIDRSDSGWIFRWGVTVTNTTDIPRDIVVLCDLDTGPDSGTTVASDMVNVSLEAGQVRDIPLRTFTVTPAVARQATGVGIFARSATSATP